MNLSSRQSSLEPDHPTGNVSVVDPAPAASVAAMTTAWVPAAVEAPAILPVAVSTLSPVGRFVALYT